MSNYEFTAEQNQKMAELSVRLRHFSIIFGVVGGIIFFNEIARWIILGIQPGLTTPLAGLVIIGGAYLFSRPLDNFRNVIETEGKDIEELMMAMTDLVLAYMIMQGILALITLLIVIQLVLLFIN